MLVIHIEKIFFHFIVVPFPVSAPFLTNHESLFFTTRAAYSILVIWELELELKLIHKILQFI